MFNQVFRDYTLQIFSLYKKLVQKIAIQVQHIYSFYRHSLENLALKSFLAKREVFKSTDFRAKRRDARVFIYHPCIHEHTVHLPTPTHDMQLAATNLVTSETTQPRTQAQGVYIMF